MTDNLISQVMYIVIHCSDDKFKLHNAFDIHKLHLSFGWDGIGYHKVIKRNGVIEHGRPEFWIGAHVYGHNKNSLGICLIGKDKFTKKKVLDVGLVSGEIVQMLGDFQKEFTHEIPIEKKIQEQIY